MGRGIFEKLLSCIEKKGEALPDCRRNTEGNFRYSISDALMCAFGVFFFQYPSMLSFQRKMQDKHRRNNMESIFGISEIPSDTQIKTLLDRIAPDQFGGVFNESLMLAESYGVMDKYRVLDGGVLLALDGVWYHSSQSIHCKHCLHKTTVDRKTKEEVTTYYHTILAGTIVKPGDTVVLPVMGELIRNEDGSDKQDCELKAAKRWLCKHADEYRRLKPTLLGDDLFSNYPMCKEIIDQGLSFIFTCKDDSHPWLSETVRNSYLSEMTRREWNGRHHLVYRYQWLNGAAIRDSRETLHVNYLSLEITNEEKGKTTYRNSWVTDKEVREDNVILLASCGRARWKIENEHNNVMKNHGYNLEHNFGHGEEHASEMYCLLNMLAFMYHGILMLADGDFRQARTAAGRRTEFFVELRGSIRHVIHDNWKAFIIYVRGEEPG
jgi:hypothetical protein